MAKNNRSNFIIMSSSYCTPEISAEFGELPPSFIPVGSDRLFHRQLSLAKTCKAQPVITIPADYVITPWDQETLKLEEVRVIRVPISLSLNEAVQFVLEVLDAKGPIYILYGDTLVAGQDLSDLDQAAIQNTTSNYHWTEISTDHQGKFEICSGNGDGVSKRSVLCGFFSFSEATELRNCCVTTSNFDESLIAYAKLRDFHTIEVSEWHDFGHLPLVYQSRRDVMVSRSFNDIQCDGVSVTKTSVKKDKIRAEANWYENIPEILRLYTPHYLGQNHEKGSYRLEYLHLPTLAELFTFGKLPAYVWRQILEDCLEFLQECQSHRPSPESEISRSEYADRFFYNMYPKRTRERLDAFRRAQGLSTYKPVIINEQTFDPLDVVCERLLSYITPTRPQDITVWHGDFFFGNILYDFRASRIRVIDPRGGYSDNHFSIYGDYRYDVAKLTHSIVGGYDNLLAGDVDFHKKGDGLFFFSPRRSQAQMEICEAFQKIEINGALICTDEIRAINALMFLTMLPLHSDDQNRQNIFLCNGLLLAQELFSKREAKAR